MKIDRVKLRKSLLKVYLGIFLLGVGLTIAPVLMGQEELQARAENADTVSILRLKGAINPISAEYIIDGIKDAEEKGYGAVLIELDTPGGLMEPMRDIISAIINTEIPVIVYVSPKGARAASAGAFITIASDIAAMAPNTNIGAASPVMMSPVGGDKDKSIFPTEKGEEEKTQEKGGNTETLMKKVMEDSVAYIKGLAESNDRNVELAVLMVTEAKSITSTEALSKNIVDILAEDIDDLFSQIEGKTFKTGKGEMKISLVNAKRVEYKMGFRRNFIYIITNPTIFYLLLMLGMAGIYFELSNPGAIFPGVIGGISIILALYASQSIPVNFAGVLLILLAVILFILEIKVTSYGLLTVGGVVSLFLGSVMLFKSNLEFQRPSMWTIILTVACVAAFFIAVIGLAAKAYLKRPSTGKEGIVGKRGVAKTDIGGEGGKAYIYGEWWDATSDTSIKKGEKVEVVESVDLGVRVKKI